MSPVLAGRFFTTEPSGKPLLLLLLLSRFSRVRLCATPETAATRLPCPWDSPGKNTGVGCHCLLQCMTVKSESEVAQPCLTPSDPMDCSLPGSSAHGIFQARVLEWGAIAFSVSPVGILNLSERYCLQPRFSEQKPAICVFISSFHMYSEFLHFNLFLFHPLFYIPLYHLNSFVRTAVVSKLAYFLWPTFQN